MKIQVSISDINQVFSGRDAADLLSQAKAEAARRAPFLLRAVVKNMSDLSFAAEVVKRANQETGRNDPAPRSAQEFLDWGAARGHVQVLEK